MVLHAMKWLSMACSVLYVILAFSVLAVSVSWYGDGVKTGVIRLEFSHVLEALIVLGLILLVVGFVGCIGSLNDNINMAKGSTAVVILIAVGFAAIAGYLDTQFVKREADLRINMTEEIATYSAPSKDKNGTTQIFWDAIQQAYNCCGIDSPNDWIKLSRTQIIPASCIPDVNQSVSFLPGCFAESLRPARKAVLSSVFCTAVMAGVLALGFICNVGFCIILKRAQDKEL